VTTVKPGTDPPGVTAQGSIGGQLRDTEDDITGERAVVQ